MTSVVVYQNIKGDPGYRIGTDGSVWTCLKRIGLGQGKGITHKEIGTWERMKTNMGRKGYLTVKIRRVKYLVHRLVLESFVGPCPAGQETRHLDGNRSNNELANLCWGTKAENINDTARHGNAPVGEKNGHSKLSKVDVMEIHRLNGNLLHREIAAIFDIPKTHVSSIVCGRKWKECFAEFHQKRQADTHPEVFL